MGCSVWITFFANLFSFKAEKGITNRQYLYRIERVLEGTPSEIAAFVEEKMFPIDSIKVNLIKEILLFNSGTSIFDIFDSFVSGSISDDEDCRPCDLKKEFNAQINVSSAVIFVVGDKTASRTAGSSCKRNDDGEGCDCTPYKQNANGTRICKIYGETSTPGPNEDVGIINSYSYLKHEFMQEKKNNYRSL